MLPPVPDWAKHRKTVTYTNQAAKVQTKLLHKWRRRLTADRGGGCKDLGNGRVHGDSKAFLVTHDVISLVADLVHPSLEGLANYTVDHVQAPVSREAVTVPLLGEVALNVLVPEAFLEDDVDGETFILRREAHLHLLTLYEEKFTRDQLFQKVNGH